MDKYIPTGFTKEEADFMDEVPHLLSHGLTMIEITLQYNEKFNTNLYSRQFHDRFDDYMIQLANRESEQEDAEDFDPVEAFLEDTQYSKAFRTILQEYEDWRMDQVEDEFQQYMQIYNENMAKYNQIMDSFREIFG